MGAKRSRRYIGYMVLLHGRPTVLASRASAISAGIPHTKRLPLWFASTVEPWSGKMTPRASLFGSRSAARLAIDDSINARRSSSLQEGRQVSDYTIVAVDGAP